MTDAPRGPTTEELRARVLAQLRADERNARLVDAMEAHTRPREDWYCRCLEPAPSGIGMIPVLRPARQSRCCFCFEDAPWLDKEKGERLGSPPH